MIVMEITKRGIQRVLLKHDTADEETEDFAAYQVIKPRLIALHAVLKDHFKTKVRQKQIKNVIKPKIDNVLNIIK